MLREGGRLAYITTNYYLNASRGNLLRNDLAERSTVLSLINFNERKIFKSAQGQHNIITFLKKGSYSENCKVVEFTGKGPLIKNELYSVLKQSEKKMISIKQSELYHGNEKKINFKKSSKGIEGKILSKISKNAKRLDEFVNVEKGLHTGADKVSQKHIDKYNLEFDKGEGIFILSSEEVRELNLNAKERRRLVPLYKNSDITKFKTSSCAELFMIDFAFPRDKELNIRKEYPKLFAHLKRYEDILSGRKDTANGLQKAIKNGIWWTIAARKKLDYDKPKIVAPQRSMGNTFGYNEDSWYGSGDIYFITNYEKGTFDLKFLVGLLNSKLYYYWLYHCGKRKGEALELYQQPISEIMLKESYKGEFIKLISRYSSKILKNGEVGEYFDKINSEIYKYYGLTKDEVKEVEDFYNSRFADDRNDKYVA